MHSALCSGGGGARPCTPRPFLLVGAEGVGNAVHSAGCSGGGRGSGRGRALRRRLIWGRRWRCGCTPLPHDHPLKWGRLCTPLPPSPGEPEQPALPLLPLSVICSRMPRSELHVSPSHFTALLLLHREAALEQAARMGWSPEAFSSKIEVQAGFCARLPAYSCVSESVSPLLPPVCPPPCSFDSSMLETGTCTLAAGCIPPLLFPFLLSSPSP